MKTFAFVLLLFGLIAAPAYADRGADYVTTLSITADQDGLVEASSTLVLLGYSSHETGGAGGGSFEFTIVDGATASGGTEVVHVENGADASENGWFGPHGIRVPGGLSIDWVAGDVDVTLYYMDR